MTTSDLVTLAKKNPLIVICVIVSLGLLGGIYYRSGAIDAANTLLEDRSAAARKYAMNLSHATQLDEQFAAVTAANKAIQARLIRPSEIGINQQFFYKLESESGVKLMDLRQSGTAPKKGAYAAVPFTVSLQGDFSQTLSFLRALENGAHYCRVQTASCNGGRTGPVTLTLNLELLGNP